MKLLKWIRIFSLCLPRVIWDYFGYMLRYSRHPEKYPLEKRYAKVRGTILQVLKQLHIHFDIVGEERLASGKQKLYVCNHTYFLDPLIMIALSSRPLGFVAKEEVKKIPVVGRLLRIIDGIFIDRNDPIATLRAFRSLSKKLAVTKSDYLIFPEGTRNRFPYGVMNEFHAGAFKLATMAELEIQPLYMFGQHRLFAKAHYRNYPVQINFFDPIGYEHVKEVGSNDFASECYGLMNESLQKAIEIDRQYIEAGQQKKRVQKWYKVSPIKEIISNERA